MRLSHRTHPCRPLIPVLVATIFASGISFADESSDWSLGRVFMTRAERLQLDKLRSVPQIAESISTTTNDSIAVDAVSKSKRNPSGYILSSNGSPYSWQDGDFRKTSRKDIVDDSKDRGFEIIKHQRVPISEEATEPSGPASIDAESTSDDDSEK